MEMEPLHPLGQTGKSGRGDAEPRIGGCRVIEVGFHGGILRIHPQAARNACPPGTGSETLPLAQRIERDVVAATHDLREIALRIDRCVGMRPGAVLLEHETRLRHGTRRGPVGMLAQQGEDAPHRTRLQRHDDLRTGLPTHPVDHIQILQQKPLIEYEARRRYLVEIHHRSNFYEQKYGKSSAKPNRIRVLPRRSI